MSNPDMEYVYNEQANAYNALVRKCAEKDALLREAEKFINGYFLASLSQRRDLCRRIRESLGGAS